MALPLGLVAPMIGNPKLFRLRRLLVCPQCDLGYRPGRLAGYDDRGRVICATCLVGADPDNETADHEETSQPCTPQNTDTQTASAAALFDL